MTPAMPRAQLSPTASDKKSSQSSTGALSPLHTRRGTHSGSSSQVTPEFESFDIASISTRITDLVQGGDLKTLYDSAHDLQDDLERLLVHNIEHQKKIGGELTFQLTGEYPSEDISSRLMPDVEIMETEISNYTPRKDQVDQVIFEEDRELPSNSNGNTWTWPPTDLPLMFWDWLRGYGDPIDEVYIAKWKRYMWNRYLPDMNAEQEQEQSTSGSVPKPKAVENEKQCVGSRTRRSSQNEKIAQEELRVWNLTNGDRAQNGTIPVKRVMSVDYPSARPILVCKRRRSSYTSPKVLPLVEDLVKAYMDEQAPDRVGQLDAIDKRKATARKEMLTNGNAKSLSRKEGDVENGAETLKLNGHSQDSMNSDGKAETMAKLQVVLKEHMTNGGEMSVKQELPSGSSDSDNLSANETAMDDSDAASDAVSLAVTKAQNELREAQKVYKKLASKTWNRLLAKHERDKREAELNKVSRELFKVCDKYCGEAPKKRTLTERERDELRSALRRCEQPSEAFYKRTSPPPLE